MIPLLHPSPISLVCRGLPILSAPPGKWVERGRHDVERVDVSEPASISTGIANRYATAVFDLAREADAIDALAADVDTLDAALGASAELRDLIQSPIYTRRDQQAAVGAVAKAIKLGGILSNTLQLMAAKRRLFVLPQLVAALRALIAEERGEVTADVTSATALSDAQQARLAETLTAKVGSNVKLNTRVDESLIGGLIVKVGSKMIDTSVRAKLAALQNTMKEVG